MRLHFSISRLWADFPFPPGPCPQIARMSTQSSAHSVQCHCPKPSISEWAGIPGLPLSISVSSEFPAPLGAPSGVLDGRTCLWLCSEVQVRPCFSAQMQLLTPCTLPELTAPCTLQRLVPSITSLLAPELCEERDTSVLFPTVSPIFSSPSHRGDPYCFFAELVINASGFFVSSFRIGIGLFIGFLFLEREKKREREKAEEG